MYFRNHGRGKRCSEIPKPIFGNDDFGLFRKSKSTRTSNDISLFRSDVFGHAFDSVDRFASIRNCLHLDFPKTLHSHCSDNWYCGWIHYHFDHSCSRFYSTKIIRKRVSMILNRISKYDFLNIYHRIE